MFHEQLASVTRKFDVDCFYESNSLTWSKNDVSSKTQIVSPAFECTSLDSWARRARMPRARSWSFAARIERDTSSPQWPWPSLEAPLRVAPKPYSLVVNYQQSSRTTARHCQRVQNNAGEKETDLTPQSNDPLQFTTHHVQRAENLARSKMIVGHDMIACRDNRSRSIERGPHRDIM